MTVQIDLRCCSSEQLVDDLLRAGVVADMLHADPPWAYSAAAPPGHGRATEHYGGLTHQAIAATLHGAAGVVARDAYALVWCTWPILEPWVLAFAAERAHRRAWAPHDGTPKPPAPWDALTGGSWGKDDERRGIGHHLLGDTEPLLVYRRGRPHPQAGPISNDWRGPRRAHSAKPLGVLVDLVRWGTPPGGLVLDLYAGASGSLARACILAGRRYVGAELDPKRHRLAQGCIEVCT